MASIHGVEPEASLDQQLDGTLVSGKSECPFGEIVAK
jgi:hypothetical protein